MTTRIDRWPPDGCDGRLFPIGFPATRSCVRGALLVTFALLGFGAKVAPANLMDTEGGMFVDDFQTGKIDQLKPGGLKAPQTVELIEVKTKKALRLVGAMHSVAFYDEQVFKDFALEVDMEKKAGGFAGVAVRENCYVFFQMRGFLCVGGEGAVGRRDKKEGPLWQSANAFRGPCKLKVVCVGPTLSVYVNDELQTRQPIVATEGRVGLYAHNAEAFFQRVSVNTKVDTKESLAVEVQAPGNALVFSPDTPVTIQCQVSSYSSVEHPVSVSVTVKTWDDRVVREKVERQVKVSPGGKAVVDFPLGRIPAGFHRIELQAVSGGTSICDFKDLPLAVQNVEAREFKAPAIPIAPYSKYSCEKTPLHKNTYAHAIARILRENNINAIVADNTFTRETLNIYQRYGIAVIGRGGSAALLNHPVAIASLEGDEPKPDEIEQLKASYAEISKASGNKPVSTCLVGEGMGLGGEHDPVILWRRLESSVRAFRWYGIKKNFYGTLHDLKTKGVLPLTSVMRVVETTAETPWWFIAPSFGPTVHEGYFQNPTPAQMKGMMHHAMAYGADGVLFYTLQTENKARVVPALIEQKSLQPCDGKLAAVSEMARLITENASLLRSLCYGSFAVENSNPLYVEAVPRRTEDGKAYLYVINKDESAPAQVVVTFRVGEGAAVRDLYSGKSHPLKKNAQGGWSLELALGPGDGALLDLATTAPPLRPEGAPPVVRALDPGLVSQVEAAVKRDGTALLRLALGAMPCTKGDGIGLLGADDPRSKWGNTDASRYLDWSGKLHERSEPGYLPLASALRLAEAAATRASSDMPDVETETKVANPNASFWTLYPSIADNGTTPGELRAMLHLALAYGSRAVLVPDKIPADLAAVTDEVAQIAQRHGKTLGALKFWGFDLRCKDARIAAVPRSDATGTSATYVVNMDTANTVTAPLLLWGETWRWTKARDVFTGQDLPVAPPDAEGYLSCSITLRPGEGKLIITDAESLKKVKTPKNKAAKQK